MSSETQTEAVVTITESAAQQIKTILSQEKENSGKGLRVYVEAGGCSGLQYGMTFDEKRPDGDSHRYPQSAPVPVHSLFTHRGLIPLIVCGRARCRIRFLQNRTNPEDQT